ncbi:MAG TPA: acyl carrier protein [Candidatus Acidoferrum sp.]|jgi:acyl carrier protein|nr:acyl carrier protein [Candidatus Acidoferrum sp.]
MPVPDFEREIHSFVLTNFLFGQSVDLQPDDSLLGRGLIDSTGVLELVDFLEERYEIKVEDEEVIPGNLDSVRKVATYVARKLSCVV